LFFLQALKERNPGRPPIPFKWPATREECEKLSGPCSSFGKIPDKKAWIGKAFWVYPIDLN
jgi:hypothetical protein